MLGKLWWEHEVEITIQPWGESEKQQYCSLVLIGDVISLSVYVERCELHLLMVQ